jgi:serine/threonine protein kinase
LPALSHQQEQSPMQSDVAVPIEKVEVVIVGNKYRLEQLIGSGGFGYVYLGTDITTGDSVAIKMEEGSKFDCSFVLHELQIYQVIKGGGTYTSKS